MIWKLLIQHNEKVCSLNTMLIIEYRILRTTITLGVQSEIFASLPPIHLEMQFIWSRFRQDIREIYSTKTCVGARHDAAVAKKKKRGGKIVSRKEKSSQRSSQNLPTPSPSNPKTQVSQSGTCMNHTVSDSSCIGTV